MTLASRLREFKYWYWTRKKEQTQIWIAWHVPKWLAKWCAVRVMVNATQGDYANQVVPELLAMDALKRWED